MKTCARSSVSLERFSKEELYELFNSFDCICLDCDGVLWILSKPIEGCANTVEWFRKMGKRVFFVTNNSLKTRAEFAEKCKRFGFVAEEEEILSGSYLAAVYLKTVNFSDKVYVIGGDAQCQELDAVGISHAGCESHTREALTREKCSSGPLFRIIIDNFVIYGEWKHGMESINFLSKADELDCGGWEDMARRFVRDPQIKCVLVGYDENFNFVKMSKATCYLEDPQCLFIATNLANNFPLGPKLILPCTGSFVKCIETSTEREPVVVGKPSMFLAEVITKKCNVDPTRTLMVGDRGDVDIVFGKRCGFRTLLVLTGCSSRRDMEQWETSEKKEERDCIPDYYIDSLASVAKIIHGGSGGV